jgi:hypothetical protein
LLRRAVPEVAPTIEVAAIPASAFRKSSHLVDVEAFERGPRRVGDDRLDLIFSGGQKWQSRNRPDFKPRQPDLKQADLKQADLQQEGLRIVTWRS